MTTTTRSTETGARGRSALVTGLVVLPVLVALIAVWGSHWKPASDVAVEILRVRDVGGRHTPFTGVQSRFGWDHPGPLLFWYLAPWYRLFGATGVMYAIGALNIAAVVGALILARRRGGTALVVLVGIVVLLLMRSLTLDLLVDPWNPWVAVLPFLVYVLVAWSVAERDRGTLVWLVVVGTFLVQTHIGYALLVVGLAAAAALLARFGPHDARDGKWPWLPALVVGAVLWLPPVLQQLFGGGNLVDIARFFRDPDDPALGWKIGWGVMGTQLRLPGAWIQGHDVNGFGTVATRAVLPALLFVAVCALAGAFAWRRGAYPAARFSTLALVLVGLGVVAVSRATGLTGTYVIRWWWVIAALLWCALAWCVLSLTCVADRPRRWVSDAGVVVVVVLAGLAVVDAIETDPPGVVFSDAIGALAPQVAPQLSKDAEYAVFSVDSRDIGSTGTGLYLELVERGYRVKIDPAYAHAFGSWRAGRPEDVDGVVTVVAGDDLDAGYRPAEGAELVAQYDPLTPEQRARATELSRAIEASLDVGVDWHAADVDRPGGRHRLIEHGADPAQLAELAELRVPGSAYVVYLAPGAS